MVDRLKHIFILVGQKGSGKTLIGSIVQELYGLTFLRVESIAQNVKKDRNVFDESYHSDLYSKIESHIRENLKDNSAIIFESTGLAAQYDNMVGNLKRDFIVVSIYVKSDPGLCIKRIKKRDASIHINVSDKDVLFINKLVREKKIKNDYTIENNGSKERLIGEIKNIFDKYGPKFSNHQQTIFNN